MLLISQKRIVRTKTEITDFSIELVQPVVHPNSDSQSADISRKEMNRSTTRQLRSGSKTLLPSRRAPK